MIHKCVIYLISNPILDKGNSFEQTFKGAVVLFSLNPAAIPFTLVKNRKGD